MNRDDLIARKSQVTGVPCAGCRACCKQDRIVLGNAEASKYAWHAEGSDKVVDRKPSGECVYLNAQGCSVHADAPDICRRFDCRVLFLTTDKTRRRQRVEENPTMRAVYEAGKKRIHTLQKEVP